MSVLIESFSFLKIIRDRFELLKIWDGLVGDVGGYGCGWVGVREGGKH